MIDRASWTAEWRQFGAQRDDEAPHRQLVACWSERHRHYHTLQHLRECLEHLDAARGHAQRPAEVAVALWFHDAFYDPTRGDNEARSAVWARECAADAGVPAAAGQRVHDMVVATTTHLPNADGDTQLLLDIDLAILGAAPARFDESNAQIRREYAHVAEADWRVGRARVLRAFLERERLYVTPRFHALLETQARLNLQRALALLGE